MHKIDSLIRAKQCAIFSLSILWGSPQKRPLKPEPTLNVVLELISLIRKLFSLEKQNKHWMVLKFSWALRFSWSLIVKGYLSSVFVFRRYFTIVCLAIVEATPVTFYRHNRIVKHFQILGGSIVFSWLFVVLHIHS